MKKILIIDDSKVLAQIIQKTVAVELKLECDIANCSDDAIALLDKHADDYVAITADLNHPGSPDGEIIEYIEPYGIPCIVLTGVLDNLKREEIIKSTIVCDYILKNTPGAFENIVAQIARLIQNKWISALIVDDSESMRCLISSILTKHNIASHCVSSAEEAISFIEKSNLNINLVITDGEMENKNGVQLTYELRARFNPRQMVIIGISGVYSRDQSIQFIKAGANDFLVKPIIVEEFVARLNKTLNAMEHAAKLEEITQTQEHTLHMIAHDIRNPLGNIFSLSNLILEDEPIDQNKCGEFLPLIKQTSQDLMTLLQRLTEFSKIKNSRLIEDDLSIASSSLVTEKIQEYETLATRKSMHIKNDLSHDVPIKCDAVLMGQVIYNLITNAIKFGPVDSTITISDRIENENWYFEVLDEGKGIAPTETELLFKAFSKLSNRPTANESSSGLGLAICKTIVDKHNGTIGYKPNPNGKGSCFYFLLPTSIN